MNILIAGGCGYIGSHTAAELIKSGHDIVICDSLVRGSVDAPDAIAEITGVPVADIVAKYYIDRR